jgi:hypothetical protein
MKKTLLFLISLFVLSTTVYAQETDSLDVKQKKKVKTGYNFGVLPTISFNSDLGFQYGAAIELYNYGDGALYPNYYERYKIEYSRFTRGSGINNFSYETTKLVPGHQIFFDINYLPDSQYDFLGVNGYEAVYNESWEHSKSKLFYKNNTNRLKIKADIINPINDKWRWTAGLEFYNFDINRVDVGKYNDGREESEKVPDVEQLPGLWDRYVEWGLIDANQVNGGSFLGIKLGMMFDTRDNWANPNKGVWTEAILITVPGFIGSANQAHLKLNFTHRQYFTIIPRRLTFAYRLSYDGVIAGTQPYYAANVMYPIIQKGATYEGLGGRRSLRGVKRNRVTGNGYFFGNAEFRFRIFSFELFNQNFDIASNIFLDAGRVVQPIDIESKKNKVESERGLLTDKDVWKQYAIGWDLDNSGNLVPNGDTEADYFNFGAEKMHYSYGIGLKLVMNNNFVISADYGQAFDTQDGLPGVYVGMDYNF